MTMVTSFRTGEFRVAGLALFCLVCMAGCSEAHLTPQKLIGKYKIQYSHGVDVLVLKAGGLFDQIYSTKFGHSVTNSGRWRIYDHEGNQEIELNHLLIVNDFPKDASLVPPQLTSASWHLREVGGFVEIVADSDGVFYYQQQPAR